MRWPPSFPINKAITVASVALNCGVILYVANRLSKTYAVRSEKAKQTNLFVDRIWKIVTQGFAAVGLVPKDLGEIDSEGVYTYYTVTGVMYFRMVSDSHGLERWEFSIDRTLWIPTAYADSLWFSAEDTPSVADKVLIQRLEVEAELRRTHRSCPVLQPPALDLSMTDKDLATLIDNPNLPKEFLCPMSMKLMADPVVTPSGITYDRRALERWIAIHHTDPATGSKLLHDQLYANLTIRDMIQKWLVEPDKTS